MPDVQNNPSENRYELSTDGHISVADYRLDGTRLVVTHVGVPEALRGQGVAAKLMAGVVADAKARALIVVPVCSYAASYLERHPQ
jgi:predicted GNAT family acetyltransferase